MNRTGLAIALTVAVVVGVLCAVDPQLDLDLAGISFDASRKLFGINGQPWVQHAREAARLIVTLLVLPAGIAIVGKLIWPHRRMLIEGRAVIFLIATLALGPGIITNVILKDHWGRSRPIDVQQFGGTDKFTPWWDPRGECPNNCSFVAGESSGAFWTMAPAALAPLELQPLAFGAALLLRHRRRHPAHRRRRTLLQRRRLWRRFRLSRNLADLRPDLSLAGDRSQ